jgi:hypothetical protein
MISGTEVNERFLHAVYGHSYILHMMNAPFGDVAVYVNQIRVRGIVVCVCILSTLEIRWLIYT